MTLLPSLLLPRVRRGRLALATSLLVLASCGGGDAATTMVVGPSTTTAVGPSTTTTVGSSTTTTVESSTTTTVGSSTTTTAAPATTTTAPPAPQTVVFTTAVGEKRWGDPDFTVTAEASSGENDSVVYAATGGCTVVERSGVVSIESVGTCSITARHPGNATWAAAESDPLTLDIAKAQPNITFENRIGASAVRYTRTLGVPMWAVVEPAIPLVYEIFDVDGAYSNDACEIVNQHLKLPGIPSLSATCGIRVQAAEPSINYEAPDPVVALIEIRQPSLDLNIVSQGEEVSFSATGGSFTLVVLENSGNGFGIWVDVWQGSCTVTEGPEPAYPSPLGTTRYQVEVTIPDPLSFAEPPTCQLYARVDPMDHAGGKSEATYSFTIVP